MSVLEQRGVFWWHDEAIAEGSEALSVLYHEGLRGPAILLRKIASSISKRAADTRDRHGDAAIQSMTPMGGIGFAEVGVASAWSRPINIESRPNVPGSSRQKPGGTA